MNKVAITSASSIGKSKQLSEQVDRGIQYIALITNTNLAYGMALEYGEPGRRAVRKCCKNMIAKKTIVDSKVLMLANAIINSKEPEVTMKKLTDDLNRHSEEQSVTYDGLRKGAPNGNF